jgi:hypothetical protein
MKKTTQRTRSKQSPRKKSDDGGFYRVMVRPKNEFSSFRNHDIGKKGHIERVAGQKQDGSWDTQGWLISKQDAHVENGRLVPDTDDAREILRDLEMRQIEEGVFETSRNEERLYSNDRMRDDSKEMAY